MKSRHARGDAKAWGGGGRGKPLACEQALLFGRAKRVLRERASERPRSEGQRKARSREARFVRPNRRACSQARKPLRSSVLARLVSLAHMGELAPRLC